MLRDPATKTVWRRWWPIYFDALLAAGMSAVQAEATPRQLIEQTTGACLDEVAGQREAIVEDPERAEELLMRIVMPHIDVDTVGRWMLGKHWRGVTDDQRHRFVKELRSMLVRSYATALAD